MTDIFGNNINPGDKIVFSALMKTSSHAGSTHRSPLITGTVDRIAKSFGEEVAIVGNFHIKSRNLILYNWPHEVR